MDAEASPRREVKKAVARQKILEAARRVFFRDGFVQANLDEVAQLAEVAKGTLYRYFENKAELYVAVLFHHGEAFQARMLEAARGDDGAADAVRRVGRFYLDHWSRNPEYFEIFWALENQPVIGELPAEVVARVTGLWRDCLRILARTIEQGVASGEFADCDSWTVANLMWTTANGLIRAEHVEGGGRLRQGPLAPAFDEMVELFLRGLRP